MNDPPSLADIHLPVYIIYSHSLVMGR